MSENMTKRVFVFGSNAAGVHGKGAAKFARECKGAQWGKGYGHYGDSFAIPTKDRNIHTLPLGVIKYFIHGFLAYAHTHPKLSFQVTRLGCGLAGYKDSDIAPMFKGAPENCIFDEHWEPWLEGYAYFSHKE